MHLRTHGYLKAFQQNKDENVYRFALSALRGKLLESEREKEREREVMTGRIKRKNKERQKVRRDKKNDIVNKGKPKDF